MHDEYRILTPDEEEAAVKVLRTMTRDEQQTKAVEFTLDGYRYVIPPIPQWAEYLHENRMGVKYGSWGYKRESH